MFNISLLDLVFCTLSLVFINYLLNFKSFLIDRPTSSKHKILNKKNIALSGGSFLFLCLLYYNIKNNLNSELIYFLSSLIILGFFSDKNIINSPKVRIITQIIIFLIIIYNFDISINFSRINYLDFLLSNNYFNKFFTIFCLLILVNGSNFIDGLNGLSTGYFLIILISILGLKPVDGLFTMNIQFFYFLIIILTIFILFNFFEKNYMGDNGIYFLSALIGIEMITFSNSNVFYISPFYIVSLLWLPAFENLFSIIRRIYKKTNVSEPDNNHLHALLFKRILKKNKKTHANNMASIFILICCLPGFILSNIYHNQSLILGIIISINISVYLTSFYLLRNEK